MPRALHTDTRTQRADDPERVSAHARALRHEPRDAPPRGVAAGIAGFLLLMLIGLGVAALLLRHFDATYPVRAAPFAGIARTPPGPRLLADPAAERRRIEARDRAHIERKGAIETAMRAVAAAGWPDPEMPPPSAEQVARDHAGIAP